MPDDELIRSFKELPRRYQPFGTRKLPDQLLPGEVLDLNDRMTSMDGFYSLYMQADGNCVLYVTAGQALWHTETYGLPVHRAIMQHDGNLVLYTVQDRPIWSSRTEGNPGAFLHLQGDGNAVIYAPGRRPLWHTNTDFQTTIARTLDLASRNATIIENCVMCIGAVGPDVRKDMQERRFVEAGRKILMNSDCRRCVKDTVEQLRDWLKEVKDDVRRREFERHFHKIDRTNAALERHERDRDAGRKYA